MVRRFDPTTLGKYDGAAAGHEGTLSDASGTIFAKPCTAAEVAFYEEANNSHPDLAYFMPEFLGTLRLGETQAAQQPLGVDGTANLPETAVESLRALNLPLSHLPSSSVPPAEPSPSSDGLQGSQPPETTLPSTIVQPDVKPSQADGNSSQLWGKKLDTDLHIVLENVSANFKQPNIMDLKLGSQLWDSAAKPEKRAKLDQVASETTSGSLGFRIAGMRIWTGHNKNDKVSHLEDVLRVAGHNDDEEHSHLDEISNMRSFDKFYGRQFNAENVIDGFRKFFLVPSAGVDAQQASAVARCFLADVKELQEVLEEKESRMYSASILLVYEGDPKAFRTAVDRANENAKTKPEAVDNVESDEDDSDEETVPSPYAVKLIDFAHATFQPGAGRDENMLKGVRSTVALLEQLIEEFDH